MKDADRQLRGVLTTYFDSVLNRSAPMIRSAVFDAPKHGLKNPYIKRVNTEAERVLRAFRAACREAVRELPGRAQRGEVDRLMRAIVSPVERKLKGRR